MGLADAKVVADFGGCGTVEEEEGGWAVRGEGGGVGVASRVRR